MTRKSRATRLILTCTALSTLLAGCASVGSAEDYVAPVAPLKGSSVAQTQTDYTAALRCVADVAGSQNYPAPRIAVGHITDMTGADDLYLGRRLTQGATLMAITAVSNAGMRVIERFDTGVTQVDLDFANNRLLRDSATVIRTPQEGQIQGVDLYIVGGISEYNHNLQSRGQDASISKSGRNGGSAFATNGDYVVDVGMDLRLIDARTTEVIAVKSYRKQVRGQQRELGALLASGSDTIDIGIGGRKNEPIQMAIRSIIDRSVFEFTAGLYGNDAGHCLSLGRQIEAPAVRKTAAAPQAIAPRAIARGAPAPTQTSRMEPAALAPPSVPLAPWLQQSRLGQSQLEASPSQTRPQSPELDDGQSNFGQTQLNAPLRGLRAGQLDQPFAPGDRSNNETMQERLRREGN
ncbi:MAG: CsgG/HfaB family protein [Hyphomonadaceae bacterium]|jgi:curli biogenesis system outer membrane secretion channel CsgG